MAFDLVNILVGPIAALLDKIIPDKDAREKMAHDIAMLSANQAHEAMKLQMEVNKVEAAHKSLFVAGWRPFIGWICGLGFASNFLIIPMTNFVLALREVTVTLDGKSELLQLPMIDLATMMPVLMGMLGLGVYRTYEKVKGVAREK